MRKLYLFLDNWNNDKNFAGSEIELIKNHFDVSIICNEDDTDKKDLLDGVNYYFYKRTGGAKLIKALLTALFDKETYKEIKNLKNESNKKQKLSEIIRFYINAELFYDFLKENGLVGNDENAIYYSYWYFYKCFALTKHKKELKGSRIITRTHEYDLFTVSIPSGYQPFKYAMDKQLDKLIFISEHGRQYYLSRYGFKASDKYGLYHLGTKRYSESSVYKRQDKFVIASCASVIKRKRVDLIVDALGTINDKEIEWVHFGSGDLFDEVKEKASKLLDCKNNISYKFMGYTKHDDVMKFYRENSVDAFLMTAVSEGNPVSVMEAMSFSIPIISCSICNMPNVIKGNGILISENPDAKELSMAIKKLCELSDEEILKLRNKSKEIWENDYVEDKNNQKFLDEVLLKL